MIDLIQMIVNGVAVGSSYALMGLAMVIIYKTSEVPNFAQGEMALISSFFAMMLLTSFNMSLYLAFFLTFVFAVLLGFFLEFAILRRAKEPNILGMIVITIGIEMIILGFVSWKFGADQKTMPFPIGPYDSFIIGDIFVSKLEVLTLVAALLLMTTLYLFFRYSKLGLAMKATQQNSVAAQIVGVRTNRIMMMTWGISSLVGAVAGLLISPTIMQPFMMWDPMLKGFAAAVMGGMTSLPGVIVAAYMLGIIENLFGGYISIEFKTVVAFVIIVLVLCVKPSGLFARHYIKKV
ncbi:MAG: branched-chain amino acid ABC transporter permease [Desulfobacula sp.]|jgi:branched-chain amino acid transport system permease protein|uniref:branched-chain amino acid ABC transporter permease n=1 Tax=Desulfobacula sp. TaxID=2593537 RepID=UPI001D434DDB|nr:branched-chain amino acid ABC transporter permease [Desulfobacula sp.]MBT3486171.1 branched-chain amino acid ABC transporter permease [Desulfobacula sp.]MBT3805641.1 branched-chain amino acid ABC transporter permease [Desulfobacula sp.]MBT4024861.1 branched-chain amino acid ABC transporter permease [Desulfobacula sp.]MBT4198751.1 branched-chain amino acid ABC transporter permease [Desulfobacula sp.]